MDRVTIDQVLGGVRAHLHLSKETENELLAEIRTHLEEAVADAAAAGEDEQAALLKVAGQFGIDEVGTELQDLHANREAFDAIIATALPVLLAILFRWLAFAPEGSALDWPQLLIRPGFWLIACAALILPFLFLQRWRFVLVGWGFFWLLTVIFVVVPNANRW